MLALQPLVSEFNIVGRLEDFVISSKGRIKYLSLSTPEEDYLIEVAKSKKSNFGKYLQLGCHLKVSGMRKYKLHQEQVEYKAYRIELLPEQAPANAEKTIRLTSRRAIATNKNKAKAKVLVCQGSSCCQKGAQAICKLLHTELKAQGMTEQVEVRTTGCMKQCKQAPYLIMPGRNAYSRVQLKQIPGLLAKYLPPHYKGKY